MIHYSLLVLKYFTVDISAHMCHAISLEQTESSVTNDNFFYHTSLLLDSTVTFTIVQLLHTWPQCAKLNPIYIPLNSKQACKWSHRTVQKKLQSFTGHFRRVPRGNNIRRDRGSCKQCAFLMNSHILINIRDQRLVYWIPNRLATGLTGQSRFRFFTGD